MINTDGCFLEIVVISLVNIHEFLWIPVSKRKPAALHLDHKPVAFFKSVSNIRQFKFHLLNFIWLERDRVGKTIPELSPHDLPTNQHLISAHRVGTSGIT